MRRTACLANIMSLTWQCDAKFFNTSQNEIKIYYTQVMQFQCVDWNYVSKTTKWKMFHLIDSVWFCAIKWVICYTLFFLWIDVVIWQRSLKKTKFNRFCWCVVWNVCKDASGCRLSNKLAYNCLSLDQKTQRH